MKGSENEFQTVSVAAQSGAIIRLFSRDGKLAAAILLMS
jgi:hypothetical protein